MGYFFHEKKTIKEFLILMNALTPFLCHYRSSLKNLVSPKKISWALLKVGGSKMGKDEARILRGRVNPVSTTYINNNHFIQSCQN